MRRRTIRIFLVLSIIVALSITPLILRIDPGVFMGHQSFLETILLVLDWGYMFLFGCVTAICSVEADKLVLINWNRGVVTWEESQKDIHKAEIKELKMQQKKARAERKRIYLESPPQVRETLRNPFSAPNHEE